MSFFENKFIFLMKTLISWNIPDVPPGERPPPATNLTLTQEAGGWVLRWAGPEGPDSKILYYTIQKKKDSQGEEWRVISKYIDVEEASYMSKSIFTFIEE